MKIKFLSSKDRNEKCPMHSEKDSKEIMIDTDTDKTTEELFLSLFHKYQTGLEESIRSSKFVFDHVDGLHVEKDPQRTIYKGRNKFSIRVKNFKEIQQSLLMFCLLKTIRMR